MSWIEKELKRRAAESARTSAAGLVQAAAKPEESEATRIAALWARLQDLNNALPEAIRLPADKARAAHVLGEDARVTDWLRARNGAALGLAGTALRYTWPERNSKKSNNFWIRWNAEQGHYVVAQRVGSTAPPTMAEHPFDDSRTHYLLKRLVLCQRVRPGSLRKRRLWMF